LILNVKHLRKVGVSIFFTVNAVKPNITFHVGEEEQEEPFGNCGVCYIRDSDRFFVPCGHPICLVCGQRVLGAGPPFKVCLFCRAVPESLLRPLGSML